MITNGFPFTIVTLVLYIFCSLFLGTIFAVPDAGPASCSPDSSSEGSPGGYSKYSCCRKVTDGNTTHTECKTCETKNRKFECGEYKQQNAANIGSDAGVFQGPSSNVEGKLTFGNNAGVLIDSDKNNDTANATLSLMGNKHAIDKGVMTQDEMIGGTNNQLIDKGNKIQSSNNQVQIPNIGSHEAQQAGSILNAPYKVKVTFDSVTVRNSHDSGIIFPQTDGEYNLAAYVQGIKVDLTAASGPGAGLWDISMDETATFKQGTQVTVDIRKGVPLSIFTVGEEVDGCGRASYPSNIQGPQWLPIFDNPKLDWYHAIVEFQNRINSHAFCSSGDDNQILGTINKIYNPPNFQAGPHTNVVSSTRDFILRYTISVAAAPEPEVLEMPTLTIVSTNPANGATGIDPSSSITATFNKKLADTDMIGKFWVGLGGIGRTFANQGTTSLSTDGHTIRFVPSSPLQPSTIYKAIIRSELKDSSGKSLGSDYVWLFTTEAGESPPSPFCNSNLGVSGAIASGDDGNVPSNVLDGNLGTRWADHGVGSWITVDIGTSKNICTVDVAWYKGNERVYNFVIATSTDGGTFATKFTGASSRTTLNPENYIIPATNARYVKVTVNGNSANDWASITELRIKGTDLSAIQK